MSEKPKPRLLTRRLFILTALLAVGVGWLLRGNMRSGWRWLMETRRRVLHGPPYALLAILEVPTDGASAGRDYLQQFPQEADVATLTRLILPQHDPQGWSVERLRETFAQQVQREFTDDAVVTADGWVLAQSEGRLLALAALWEGL